jgi:hypothetical protein
MFNPAPLTDTQFTDFIALCLLYDRGALDQCATIVAAHRKRLPIPAITCIVGLPREAIRQYLMVGAPIQPRLFWCDYHHYNHGTAEECDL